MPVNDTNQQFQALFDYASIGIVVTEQTGRIINFNRYAEKQFGYLKAEVLEKSVEELIPDKFHASHTAQRNHYYAHPEPRIMGAGRDLYAKRKDGSVFPVEVSLSHYVLNRAIFVIAFVVDITVRKNSEAVVLSQKAELENITRQVIELNRELEQRVEDRTKMLRETLAELEKSKAELSEALESEKELSDLKSRFVTLASHEFRTPLSTILSSAYLLEQYTAQDGKTGKHIHRIKNAVSAMKNILEDFLSLGKLEEGIIQINNDIISAGQCFAVIQTVIEEFEHMLKPDQKIDLQCYGDNTVTLDRNLLKNILINLVSNAIKFSPQGSMIHITANIKQEALEISVTDNGIGMSVEDQEHLFERFFRGKNVSNIQGTGLGLHIIKKYLELMGGKIEVSSLIHKGSTFTVYVPGNRINHQL